MSTILTENFDSKLGIIAGSGKIPQIVYQSAKNEGWRGCIIRLEGFSDDYYYNWQTFEYPIGKVDSIVKKLKDESITDIIICGGIDRRNLRNFSTDFGGVKLLAKIAFKGDDGASKIICDFLENQGFKIHHLNEFILNSNPPVGHFAGPDPNQTILLDIEKGIEVLKIVSKADIGQSLVIQNGLVLALEAIEGTDKMINRCSELKNSGFGPVLIKFSKIGQEMKIDQPVIGPKTIEIAKKFNFSCVACEAENVLIVDYEKTIDIANKEEITLYGFMKD